MDLSVIYGVKVLDRTPLLRMEYVPAPKPLVPDLIWNAGLAAVTLIGAAVAIVAVALLSFIALGKASGAIAGLSGVPIGMVAFMFWAEHRR